MPAPTLLIIVHFELWSTYTLNSILAVLRKTVRMLAEVLGVKSMKGPHNKDVLFILFINRG